MSTYSIPTLLRLWRQNEATVEQAIGHALQHIAGLTERLTAVEKRLRHLEQAHPEMSSRTAHLETPQTQV